MTDVDKILNALKGQTGTGYTISAFVDILKKDYGVTLEPGDLAVLSGEDKIVMAAPIAYDLWYLFNHTNMMTYVEEVDPATFFNTRLDFFDKKLGGIKAMKGVRAPGDVTYDWFESWLKGFAVWRNESAPWIQLMAFEIMLHDQLFLYDTGNTTPADAVGYLIFPAGQLGVMEVISMVQQTVTEEPYFRIPYDELPVLSNQLLPPFDKWQKNKCYGSHVIESSYIKVNPKLILNTEGLSEWFYEKAVEPKGWMRLWITREDKFPVPGEFIGFLCKPSPVPPHCWWFQETTPFVYAGNWVDTENLTSGIITEVVPNSVHPNLTKCTKYKIKIHGIEVEVYSSDFIEYEVGDRVGVLKLESINDNTSMAFNFRDQKYYGDPTEGLEYTKYVIVPITFFKEV